MRRGFTLIELLVVIAIIGVLSFIVLSSLNKSRENTKVAQSGFEQNQMTKAIELYFADMDFYPPDVGRGWDPGFVRGLPYNSDTEADCAANPSVCPACSHCPPDWINQVGLRWRGPYMSIWPTTTAWGGEYDYNYWPAGASRYGCSVLAGIYVGVQGDYNNNNTIPPVAEQKMIDKKFDSEQCLNGESQMLLWSL